MKNVLMQYLKKGVRIEYEIIDEGIYVHTIRATKPGKGMGTFIFKKFLDENKNQNIYLQADSSMGTPLNILFDWYKKLGFEISEDTPIDKYEYNCFLKKDR